MKMFYACLAWFISARTFALPEPAHESTMFNLNISRHGNTLTEASIATDDEYLENYCALPWNVSMSAEQELSDPVFSSLLQCLADLQGCSEELTACHNDDIYMMTCSCASNCEIYGDCCWSVGEPFEMSTAGLPGTSCVSVEAQATGRQFEYHPPSGAVFVHPEISERISLRMVAECPASWPHDDVRKACEEPDLFQEIFYGIPVTTDHQVTYRNGFCALCNNDTIDGAFWDTKLDGNETVLLLPGTVSTKPAHQLRPCTDDGAKDTCNREVSEAVSRKCETHYAPVRDIDDGTVFKNIYCALCNGANTSRLSCGLMLYLENKDFRGIAGGPSLAALFKPVTTTPVCRAFYNGRCYIPRTAGLQGEDLNSSSNESHMSKTPQSQVWSPENFGAENYVTLACMSVSMLCLVLKILVFGVFTESRTFLSKCTLCLSVTLLVTHTVFVVTNFVHLPAAACVTSAVLVHYGILSTLCWTCALSFDVYRCLTVLKVSSNRDSTLVAYGIFSWGTPVAIVSSALVVDGTASESLLSPSYGRPTCWIGTFWGLVLYFLAPAFVLLLSCLIFYFMTASYIGTASIALNAAKDARTTRERTHATLFLRLALVMGSPWPVAFLATFVQSKALDAVVNGLVGLQGAYLFFIFQDYRHLAFVGKIIDATSVLAHKFTCCFRSRSGPATTNF